MFWWNPFKKSTLWNLTPLEKSVESETNKSIKSEEVEGTLSTLKDWFVEMSDTFKVIPEVIKDLYK